MFFQLTNMEMIYQYVAGPQFRHRIHAIVEKFADMQEDLDRKRKTMTKLWAKRQEQIRCVVDSTAGMYGDMQGIAERHLRKLKDSTSNFLRQMKTRDCEPTDHSNKT